MAFWRVNDGAFNQTTENVGRVLDAPFARSQSGASEMHPCAWRQFAWKLLLQRTRKEALLQSFPSP
jgi:hypothetical protein